MQRLREVRSEQNKRLGQCNCCFRLGQTGMLNAVPQMKEQQMPEAEIGWIAAIIVGGLAGWFAEIFMKSGTGIFMNIVLGIVGAALANWILGLLGIGLGGWIGYLIAGFIGACIIIALWRAIRGRQTI
jgi:uncharacterized membrane protein YeaQ/YmgE (transglycosylase-associated protein family)